MRRGSGILIALLVILALGVAGFIGFDYYMDQQQAAARAALSAKIDPLSKQRETLMRERDSLQAEMDAIPERETTMQLLFNGLDIKVYTTAYPVLDAAGVTGMVMLSANELPDSPGKMTMDEFQELMAAGWECCIQYSGDEEEQRSLEDTMEILGIQVPKAVFFRMGSLRMSDSSSLGRYSYVIHHGELGLPMISQEVEDPWYIGTKSWTDSGDDFYAWIDEAAASGGEIVATVDVQNEVSMKVEDFSWVLEDLMYYEKAGIKICTLDEARALAMQTPEERDARKQQYRDRISELNEQIAAKNEEISQAYSASGLK